MFVIPMDKQPYLSTMPRPEIKAGFLGEQH